MSPLLLLLLSLVTVSARPCDDIFEDCEAIPLEDECDDIIEDCENVPLRPSEDTAPQADCDEIFGCDEPANECFDTIEDIDRQVENGATQQTFTPCDSTTTTCDQYSQEVRIFSWEPAL